MPGHEDIQVSNIYHSPEIKTILDCAIVEQFEQNRNMKEIGPSGWIRIIIYSIMLFFPVYCFFYREDYPRVLPMVYIGTAEYIILSIIIFFYDSWINQNKIFETCIGEKIENCLSIHSFLEDASNLYKVEFRFSNRVTTPPKFVTKSIELHIEDFFDEKRKFYYYEFVKSFSKLYDLFNEEIKRKLDSKQTKQKIN